MFNLKPNPKDLPKLPEILEKESQIQYDRLKNKLTEEQFKVLESRPEFKVVIALSDFVANTIFSYPKECIELIENGELDSAIWPFDIEEELLGFINEKQTDIELKKKLRIFRRIRCMAIAWRDLVGMADIEEVFFKLSNLAEKIILRLIDVVRAQLVVVHGDALDKDNLPIPLLTLGMGKLGGGELNFSSDIDLVFTYTEDGETHGRRPLSHKEFFTKVVQRCANLLSDKTIDTFCYRVDLRLRPFGDAGSLVNSIEGMSIYYETQGRTWERYALVKAKLLGDERHYRHYGAEFIDMLRPFVYRKYLDYGAVQSLRKLKHMIESEVRRRALNNNFKLGSGGIREVEFIAQVFELMRGGRFVELRERNLRKTLKSLVELELLPEEISVLLDTCYLYLRRLENCIQEFSDKQTQNLPESPRDKARLLYALNYQDYDSFLNDLHEVMKAVHNEFKKVVADEKQDNSEHENLDLWGINVSKEELADNLKYYLKVEEDCTELAANIISLKQLLSRMPVGPVGRQTLLELMPKVIMLVGKEKESAKLFKKLAMLIEQIALRTPYMQLLRDNNFVLERFISLLKENHYASELITYHPILLDELFIPQYFDAPPSCDEFFAMLQERLLRIEEDDLETVMEELRLFKKVMVFRIALSDKAGRLPLMKISDALTWLAEAIVKQLLILAWEQNVKKYGEPEGRSVNDPGLAIIGYGKLGGIELGYKSDLDMVFIRQTGEGMTNGERPISVEMFYQRLVQRLLHLSTTKTVGGVLYDLDMRLRPDGDTGVLISDYQSFYKYQDERAWTWEHQALSRARPIAGSKDIIEEFNQIRDKILRKERDEMTLKKDVVQMRQKMREHLDRSSKKIYDLKQGKGGIIDIEFISQYLMLLNASKYPSSKLWSDNVRILEECASLNLIKKEQARILIDAYIFIRRIYHEMSLANVPRIVESKDRPKISFEVEKIWKQIFKGVD